jgi:XisI protein
MATKTNTLTLQSTVERLLTEWKDFAYSQDGILSFDRTNNHYMLLWVGWHGQRRVHNVILHIDIIDDKCWIQADNTPNGIALELEEAGIPKEQIVLAFYPLEHRQHTNYAAG